MDIVSDYRVAFHLIDNMLQVKTTSSHPSNDGYIALAPYVSGTDQIHKRRCFGLQI